MADGGSPRETQAQLGHRGPQFHVRLHAHEADIALETILDLGTSQGTYVPSCSGVRPLYMASTSAQQRPHCPVTKRLLWYNVIDVSKKKVLL
jgi:hypothetical protein